VALGLLPAAPTTVSAASLALSWQDHATDADGYRVERGPSATGPFTPLATDLPASATSYVDTSVAPGTQYCYRVSAFNASGASGFTNVACATTAATTPPPTGPVTVDFDAPAPPGASGSTLTLFGGIDWGGAWCWWSAEPGLDATNHVDFCRAGVSAARFAFAPGPRTLISITLVSLVKGKVTISDDRGQKKTVTLAPGKSLVVNPGWRKPSASITVTSPVGWDMAVTSVTYK